MQYLQADGRLTRNDWWSLQAAVHKGTKLGRTAQESQASRKTFYCDKRFKATVWLALASKAGKKPCALPSSTSCSDAPVAVL